MLCASYAPGSALPVLRSTTAPNANPTITHSMASAWTNAHPCTTQPPTPPVWRALHSATNALTLPLVCNVLTPTYTTLSVIPHALLQPIPRIRSFVWIVLCLVRSVPPSFRV